MLELKKFLFIDYLVIILIKQFLLQLLESLLPPRPQFEMPSGDNVEEVDLNDHHPTDYNATQESDDDEEPQGARVGCAQQ